MRLPQLVRLGAQQHRHAAQRHQQQQALHASLVHVFHFKLYALGDHLPFSLHPRSYQFNVSRTLEIRTLRFRVHRKRHLAHVEAAQVALGALEARLALLEHEHADQAHQQRRGAM